jgi:polar amino acid transport system substrate-binding protein
MFKALLIATAVLFSQVASAAETWKITSLDWQPFSGKALPEGGASIAVLRAALKAEGIELQVEFYPWTRAIETAKQPGYAGVYPSWPEDVAPGFTGSARAVQVTGWFRRAQSQTAGVGPSSKT